ncbi:hypothetical protein D8I30_13550 [Brevundimonas naejangsanensis]|uniref:Peptidoglycan-binding protein n=1 Tax=Brevundimonas naejangsanensis TaxID=588932 RepID=A0A494RI14_9CAUL|nr:hypothetical protein [Brevundimonas naejangsanensis]AYG96066.1 hypothetical protein D8I30_13460 [Brevundimonas naejangsanensis]AYG96078.1 hypothetical protein D8I30_13550 [Brevundimonas naejangsanensis]
MTPLEAIRNARALLNEAPAEQPKPLRLLAAAAFAATAAVLLAGTMVAGPGVSFDQGSTVSNP